MSTPFEDAINTLFGSNLKRLWKLHETSGSTADDATGNQDGTYVGATLNQSPLSQDASAKSVLLDGVDDSVDQASTGLFGASPAQPIGVGIVCRSSTTQTDRTIAAFERLSSSRRSIGVYVDASGKFAAAADFQSDPQRIETGNVSANDDAVHLLIVVAASATDLRFYIDDALDGQNTGNHAAGTSGSDYEFRVGYRPRPDGSGPFNNPTILGRYAGRVEFAFLWNAQDITLADVQTLDAALRSGGGGGGTPLGIAGETDSAQPLAPRKRRGLGLSAETDSAQPLSPQKRRAITVAEETDAALPLVRRKRRALGVATETDAGESLASRKRRALGIAAESDQAESLAARKRRVLGIAGETDTALPLSPGSAGETIGVAIETDTAMPLLRRKRRALGIAIEADTALALSRLLPLQPITRTGIPLTAPESRPHVTALPNRAHLTARTQRAHITAPRRTRR